MKQRTFVAVKPQITLNPVTGTVRFGMERANQVANSQNLEDMKLPELKELAKQMGLRGTSTMRKPELLATLQAARSGGKPPAGVTVRTPKASSKKTVSAPVPQNNDAQDETGALAGVKSEPKQSQPSLDADSANDNHAESPRAAHRLSTRDVRGGERESRETNAPRKARKHEGVDMPSTDDLLATLDLDEEQTDSRRPRRRDDLHHDSEAPVIRRIRDDEDEQPRRRRRETNADEGAVRDLDDILATLPSQKQNNADDDEQGEEHEFTRRNRRERNDRNDRRNRRMRGRDRDRDAAADEDRRDTHREEPAEDLVPVAGIVDVLDSYAFVRTSGYLPGPNDVYVSMGQVKKYGLRKGDAVHGSIRAPRENDRRNQRQKFVPLQAIDSINGMSVEDAVNRPQFAKLTPLYPQERLKQETTANKLTGRIMDIVSPIGKGQRGLIVSPPKAGKTITLQNIANSIAANNPEVHLMVVLVDERPEEVTDMERTVQGEVISSTFDRPASDHTTVAELAIERAKRLVELGQDVVVLLDSMTRLARAYNIAAPASGRILSGGVDAQALYPPKKFFGAARNIENGGSLTIISSALVETGSKMDEVIFEEFKGTGNMELRLSRELADKRLFPAIDINASGTRREELITNPQELPIIYRLRRLLGGMEPEQAYQTLVPRLKKTATNRDFLAAIVQQANAGSAVNGN